MNGPLFGPKVTGRAGQLLLVGRSHNTYNNIQKGHPTSPPVLRGFSRETHTPTPHSKAPHYYKGYIPWGALTQSHLIYRGVKGI